MAAFYAIKVEEHLDHRWSEWLDGFAVAHCDDGTTLLSGPVADQSALYGLLIKLRDLGLSLISVNREESEEGAFFLSAGASHL